ncbi:MAG: hypothetical protein MSB06_03920, partial [Mitsuokella jalaludinii]|nr:hypothetical protein [Mitsuokella jalaludinii]
CARTFTDATMRIFSTTKLDRSAWMRFAECHVDMLPLRESAEKCGVCLGTVNSFAQIQPAVSMTAP